MYPILVSFGGILESEVVLELSLAESFLRLDCSEKIVWNGFSTLGDAGEAALFAR